MLSDATAPVPDWYVRPKSFVRSNWCLRPLMKPALIAGMLSENWRAFRRRTGPRSRPSAWVGVKAFAPDLAKLVITSMNIVAAVIVLSSIPMRYTSGLIDEPGCRQPSDRTSNWGWNLPVALPGVGGRTRVGEDLARAVVDDAGGGVVDVVATEGLDPGPLAARDAAALEDLVRVLGVRDDRRRVHPLLHDALHPVVERRDDPVAARVDLLALGLAAQDLAQLRADLPHELRGAPLGGRLRTQDHRFLLGGLVVGVGVLARRQHGLGLHLVEDEVAALHDLAAHRHHQPHLLGALGRRCRSPRRRS